MNLCSLHFIHAGIIKTIITNKNLLPETENSFQLKHSFKITFDTQNNSVATYFRRITGHLQIYFFVIELLKNLTFMCCFAPPLPKALCS